MPNSMTGFARQEIQAPWGILSCEIRSVNHRYLEPLIRLPESLRSLETYIRDQCRRHLQRGKVEVTMQLTLHTVSSEQLSINQPLVEQLSQALTQVTAIAQQNQVAVAPIDPIKLLQWPEVIEQQTLDMQAIEESAKALTGESLSALIAHRQREGAELKQHIEQRLQSIDELVEQVKNNIPEILQAQKEKLQQRIADLQIELEEDRLLQEITLLSNKADVDEELDRLNTHIAEVRHILGLSGAIGRRLDFMMQELNREANTLSSKSIHTDTTQAAVSLKVLIEQMREQIQNIE